MVRYIKREKNSNEIDGGREREIEIDRERERKREGARERDHLPK